jgi:hypothetical protein
MHGKLETRVKGGHGTGNEPFQAEQALLGFRTKLVGLSLEFGRNS